VKLSAEDAAENVLLHTPNLGDPIGDATELVISGGGYGSFDEAEQAGKRWRQHLTVALARFGIGADLGPATDVQARRGDGLIGEQFYEDRPGLQVLEYEAGAMFLRSSVDLIRKRPLGNFLNGPLRSELEKEYVPRTDSHELAYSLIHAAYFDANPESVHVVLVTAIEAIIDAKRQKRGQAVDEAVAELKSAVKPRFPKSDPNQAILLNALAWRRQKASVNAGSVSRQNYFPKTTGRNHQLTFSKLPTFNGIGLSMDTHPKGADQPKMS
jgi:hypothetical protein